MTKIACVQIQLGNNKFKFKDVDVKSTSLNNIIKNILGRAENNEDSANVQALKDLLYSGGEFSDINNLISSGASNTDIAEFAVGNTTARGLFTLSHFTETNDSLSRLSTLSFGNNILITTNSKNTGYIGRKRAFLTLNSNTLDNKVKLSQALSFSYLASNVNDDKLSFKDLLKSGISKLEGINDQEVREFLDCFITLDEENKYKQLLSALPLYKDSDKIREYILYPLARQIYKDSLNSNTDKAEQVNAYTLLRASTLSKNVLKDRKVMINGNYYDVPFILQTFNKAKEFDSQKTQINPELKNYNISEDLAKFISSLQSDSSAYRLMMDLINNENIDIREAFSNEDKIFSTNTALNNILNKLFIHNIEDPIENLSTKEKNNKIKDLVSNITNSELELYFPLVDNINFDADINKDTRIALSTINSKFNKSYKNYPSAFQFVLTNEGSSFISIGNEKKSQVLKVYINPNKDYTEKDRDALRKAITTVTGKSVRNKLFVAKQKSSYLKDKALNKLSKVLEDLITNNQYIQSVEVAGVGDFGLDVIKAAASNKIKTTLYPNYYLSDKYNKFELYQYLDSELNLNFSSNPVIYVSSNEELESISNSSNYISLRNTYGMSKAKIGDVVKVRNPINGNETKKLITRKIDFSFNPEYTRYGELNSNSGEFNNGTVVSYSYNGSTDDYLIIKSVGDKYLVKNINETNDTPFTVSKSEINSNAIPLYKAGEKIIGENIYYRHSNGIFRINFNSGIPKYTGVEIWREYYEEDLKEIYNNSLQDSSFEDFLDLNFPNSNSFKGKTRNIFIKSVPYSEEAINKYNPTSELYNNQGLVELIIGSMRRSGVKIRFMDSESIKNLGITTNPKAFIHNGEIILNKDKYTVDSPIHELMHLLLGQLKVSDPDKYREMLDTVSNFDEYNQLREVYPELAQNDYSEEVLVHVLTNQLLGKIYDSEKQIQDSANKNKLDLKKLVSEVFKVDQNLLRDYSDSELLNTNLKTLLIDNNSSILNDLLGLIKMPEILVNNQISNMKSKLLKEGNLTEDCK